MKLRCAILTTLLAADSSTESAASHLSKFHGLRAATSSMTADKRKLAGQERQDFSSTPPIKRKRTRQGIFDSWYDQFSAKDPQVSVKVERTDPPPPQEQVQKSNNKTHDLFRPISPCPQEVSIWCSYRKLKVCHFNEESDSFETICIRKNIVSTHLMDHNLDYCGECTLEVTTTEATETTTEATETTTEATETTTEATEPPDIDTLPEFRQAMTMYHLKLDCDHELASDNDVVTSDQVCAKFTVRGIDQVIHSHEVCEVAPNSCPEFFMPVQRRDSLVEVSVYANGDDPLLVDSMEFDIGSDTNLTLWRKDEGARCLSNSCNSPCMPNVLGAEYPMKGVLFRADGSWTNLLYEDGHCCEGKYQCESNICLDSICQAEATGTTTPPPTPAHDEIFCGSSVSDDITGLSPVDMPFCGTSNGAGGAIWYKFVGTGVSTTLSTCGGLTNYDTKIRVYKADADNTCVAGNDDNCPNLHSSVEFTAEAGVEYNVLVHGWGPRQGVFELTVECDTEVTTSVPLSLQTHVSPAKAQAQVSETFTVDASQTVSSVKYYPDLVGGTCVADGVKGNNHYDTLDECCNFDLLHYDDCMTLAVKKSN